MAFLDLDLDLDLPLKWRVSSNNNSIFSAHSAWGSFGYMADMSTSRFFGLDGLEPVLYIGFGDKGIEGLQKCDFPLHLTLD